MAAPARVERPPALLARRLRGVLKRGGVVAYPTESCYGLGCDPRQARAVRRILRLKGRPGAKGLIVLGGAARQLAPYAHPALPAETRERWPGPYTFLLPASRRAGPWVTGGRASVALRWTAHPQAAGLALALGMAITSTSANRSGLRAARSRRECARAFPGVPIAPGRVGRRRRPSTIIDLATGRVVRP